MTYMLWQIMNMKAPLPKNIQDALDYHKKKYGQVPNLIEYGMKAEMPPIDGIRYCPVQMPANILLLAVE